MPVERGLVKRHFGVESDEFAAAADNQRIDLHQGGVLFPE